MSQSQSEGATMNLRPNLDPRILPGFYSAIRTQSSIDYSKQLTVFWRFQIFKSASTFPMRFTQFRAFLAVTTSLAHHDHMSTWLAQYPYIPSFYPICCVTAEAFPRLSLMDILSVRKELEKVYSLVTTHGSTAEAGFGSSASDSQIL